MQLVVLKLNTGIGRTLGHVATLQRENAQLSIEDSMYSSENRVAPLAAAAGMTLAPAGTVHFVAASKADISRAAAALCRRVAQASASATSATSAAAGESSTTRERRHGSRRPDGQRSGSVQRRPKAPAHPPTATSGEDAAGSSESQPSRLVCRVALRLAPHPRRSARARRPDRGIGRAGARTASSATTAPSSSSATAAPSSGPRGGTQAGTRE